ncbi:MAG: hypothetical protein UW73_C0038G0002 [Microgenomates group bacterium GW2011_GWB1_44_8]|nr:MAG: hypothetical protein UW73_C0038G0002 [Microgenomates group bacterium GW2011_GWB1_44_8]
MDYLRFQTAIVQQAVFRRSFLTMATFHLRNIKLQKDTLRTRMDLRGVAMLLLSQITGDMATRKGVLAEHMVQTAIQSMF